MIGEERLNQQTEELRRDLFVSSESNVGGEEVEMLIEEWLLKVRGSDVQYVIIIFYTLLIL